MGASREDIIAITDEFNYVISQFAEDTITRKVAESLVEDIKKTATEKGVPFVVNDVKAVFDRIAKSKDTAAAGEEFDDGYDDEESSSDEYSEDEEM